MKKGSPLSDHIGTDNHEVWNTIYKRASTGEHFVEELHYELPDGRIDVEVSVSPIIDSCGKITGVTFFSKDVTKRKQADKSLWLLKSVVDNANEVVMITDTQTGMHGPAIIYVNHVFTQLTGYLPQEVIGKSPRLLQRPNSDPAMIRQMQQSLVKGENFTVEVINYAKDRREYLVELTIFP